MRAGWSLAFLVYLALTLGFTWPLARDPARLGVPNHDVYGNIWAMAWVDHQAVREPLRLFDSNMFFPWTKSLAYAESLLPQALQAAPVRALGGSPLLAYNLVMLLSFPLSALGAGLLAAQLSGSRGAGFLAGLAYAFCAYRWDHMVHVQSLSAQWLPFALYFALRCQRDGRARDLVGLALSTLAQLLSSGYYAMLTLLALALALGFSYWPARRADRLLRAAAGVGLAVLLALPVFREHRSVQERHRLARGDTESIAWSARLTSYLDPGPYVALPHQVRLRAQLENPAPLYPGSWALVFGALALSRPRSRSFALALAWLALGFVLSLGPLVEVAGVRLPTPFSLFRLLPGGALLRTPSRFAVLALLGLACLAALGWARLYACSRRRRLWLALGAAWLLAEAYPAELRGIIRELPPVPPAAGWLARAPRGPVLELPWNEPADAALHVYWSTSHWQPLVNGFGSFDPPGNFGLGLLGNRWPSAYSARVFRERGISYVVVHTDRLKPAHRGRLLAATGLPEGVALVAAPGADRVYWLAPAAPERPAP